MDLLNADLDTYVKVFAILSGLVTVTSACASAVQAVLDFLNPDKDHSFRNTVKEFIRRSLKYIVFPVRITFVVLYRIGDFVRKWLSGASTTSEASTTPGVSDGFIPYGLEGTELLKMIPLDKRRLFDKIMRAIMSNGFGATPNVQSKYVSFYIDERLKPLLTIRHSRQVYFFPLSTAGKNDDKSTSKYIQNNLSISSEEDIDELLVRAAKARDAMRELYGI